MHEFTSIEGDVIDLGDFRGKAVMVVNTASQCGYTKQYRDLQSLWETYQNDGLVVLGVPSNDFGGQEPGSNRQVKKFCENVYKVDFPLTVKTSVTGRTAHPFYQYAEKKLGKNNTPQWNFHKYLINAEGELVEAFPSKVEPDAPQVISAIEKALPSQS
jgi:glutathione peroxidase